MPPNASISGTTGKYFSFDLRVADIYLSGVLKEPPREEKKEAVPVRFSKQELEEKAGHYEDDRFHAWLSLTVKDGRMMMAGMGYEERPLSPLSKTLFQAEDAPGITLEFLPTAQGKPRQAVLNDVEDEERYSLTRAAPLVPLTPEKLKEYTGDYVSGELLGYINLEFVRRKGKRIAGFKLSIDGAADIEFVRK